MTPFPPPTILISTILTPSRLRADLGDLPSLAESILTYGTIEPIVLWFDTATATFTLLAGGRRLAACQSIGITELHHGLSCSPGQAGYVFRNEASADLLVELELEENVRRKSMTWQEEARAIARGHRLKALRHASVGDNWGYRETGRMFGIALGHVGWMLKVDLELQSPSSPVWQMQTAADAARWFKEQEAREIEAELARRQIEITQQGQVQTLIPPSNLLDVIGGLDSLKESPADPKDLALQRYLSNPHNPPDRFEEYWASKSTSFTPSIPLTSRMFLGDAIDCLYHFRSRFDHIICDPPYGIDTANMDQTNLGMVNIDSIADTHEVEPNKALLKSFLKAAYSTLPDNSYCLLWCDYSFLDYLTGWATLTGFRVQRWPIIWLKTHPCLNSMARLNFTKTTEPCIVLAKGTPVLAITSPVGHVIAPHDDFKTKMQHPFVKPFLAWQHLIKSVSLPSQTIIDPFGGEGSGTLSTIRCERNWLYGELDPVHYNRAMENLKAHYTALQPGAAFI